ncbi:transglycosylase SLT domain-containing protein [Halomonas sp. G15]|uniref:transglycosylase SLT domain-containing protein n=1 Tax=Halomonas sp. G15 TaxID=2903521 RepID=UPI003FA5A2DD
MMCEKSTLETVRRRHGPLWRGLVAVLLPLMVSGCAMLAPSPPANQTNICEIFREQPDWYDYARASQAKWGTPVATQMAIIERESSFRSHVKPPRTKLLGFIPWRRPSSAYGYAQAQDPVWGEYEADAGRLFARRTHMKHATDFIGWYNARTRRMTGVSLYNPEHLYLAYHEGQGGYRRGSWRGKPAVRRAARDVASTAARYRSQLASCEAEFRCDGLLEIWPFCRG